MFCVCIFHEYKDYFNQFSKYKTNSNPPITENHKSGFLNWGEYQI